MGVQGLSTFIDENKHLFLTDHKLHDTKVIIDGSNLFHFLYYHYKISPKFGGDYDHFARKCKRFFNILKECNITPYIVFDGGYNPDDRKLPTVLERMNDRRKKVGLICAKGRGCVLPILSYETFRQVLVELNIAHVACAYEADREIAVLAKRWACPVLSNDSDFFVYGLDGGYVPLDYINLTLCVYNTKTKEASVLEKNYSLAENEFVYIPVKYYHFKQFVKKFEKEDSGYILPMFATVMGNDYVEYSLLYTFYTHLHTAKNPSNKSLSVKASGRMESILHWLTTTDSGEHALEQVLATVTKEKREATEQILKKSITEYKDIDEFESFDLEEVLQSFSNQKSDESDHPESDGLSELPDYYGRALPDWFVRRMRKCEINGGFLQNVSVVHRVIFNCQVETLRESSSYTCSRDLRALIYGIVLSPIEDAELAAKQSRQNCVEEYDRQGKNTKKFYVRPVQQVTGGQVLPSLQQVPSLSTGERKKLLLAGFGFSISNELFTENLAESSKLIILILSYWVKHAQPKVSEHHLSSLIVGMIMLHINALDWVNMKKSLGFSPFEPVLLEDIVKAIGTGEERKLNFFKKHMERYFSKPEHSTRFPRDNKVVHGFALFQTTFLDAMYLNQVLLSPVPLPSPSVILNCTFVYNLCRDLDSRAHANNYLNEMLGNGSPMQGLFIYWKEQVISLCKEGSFDSEKQSVVGVKTKNKSKSKKAKKSERSINKKEITESGSESLSDEDGSKIIMNGEELEVNCDVSNRFSLLNVGD